MSARWFRTIKVLIVAGMAASVLHFADNAFAIEHYPEPGWITPFGVVASWCVVTAVALVAVTRKRADGPFLATTAIYILVLLSGLLHYAFGPPMHMALRSHVTVLAEALTGFALAGALLGSSISGRRGGDQATLRSDI
jgi:hypothetical protein